MKILNFGSLNIDHVYQVAHFVKPGETIASLGYRRNVGGKGLNQSIALARAGLKPFHAGAVGYDGDVLLDALQRDGVDTHYISRLDDSSSGQAFIQVDASGENCIILNGGANHCITDAQIRETLSDFGKDDWLLLQNELNDVERIWEAAAHKGMRVVWNPSPVAQRPACLGELPLHMIILNEVEAAVLCEEREAERQMETLSRMLPATEIVLTLGEAGSMVYEPDTKQVIRQAAAPAEPVDTTAAGDTYLGYYIAMRFEKNSVCEAAKVASAAAARAVETAGAAASIPAIETLRLQQQM